MLCFTFLAFGKRGDVLTAFQLATKSRLSLRHPKGDWSEKFEKETRDRRKPKEGDDEVKISY